MASRHSAFIDQPGRAWLLDLLRAHGVEAMFAGLPVVTTGVGGIPEMVLDGETGLLVPPGDEASIADAIERLLGDDALRTAMGEAARERAHARFDARKTTADLISVLAEAQTMHSG